MTTTTTTPDVPLPPGTLCPDGWQDGGYRLIAGKNRYAPGTIIGTTAAQLPDGGLDDGSRIEAPNVWVAVSSERIDWPMTADTARQVGCALIAAADEIDGWATR